MLAFFSSLQFQLNEFGLPELISDLEIEAINTLSALAVKAIGARFAPEAFDASAASSIAWEGELFAVEENEQCLRMLLEAGLTEVHFSSVVLPGEVSHCLILNILGVFQVSVITAWL